ncbi:GNAT family N-acetyltransferase [Sulfitobacter sp. S0837]|uniref:GNAT family N-acetyltransferase n=1 Tax=Sulfitobacter maritimus TaxID=2741719 RepID=UPI001581F400|nr:GNAT family N-acyltransferase [Sulfitobacter maritimus]NUH64419.1 GNAT family N-acetyltransferase [Sulfitobacter maritimus]
MTHAPPGRFHITEARSADDLAQARTLRALCFRNLALQEADDFDQAARHIVVKDRDSEEAICCFRVTTFSAATLHRSYSAQVYDLSALRHFDGPMLELGRFCIHPDWHDPDILRLAWGWLAGQVDAQGAELLFGCSSFAGVDAARYRDAFALLNSRHLAPPKWQPGVKASEVIRFASQDATDMRAGLRLLPPLLRSYLTMGGWVSDHAVVDRAMNTIHVFTGLEIAAIPPGRKRLLRALAMSKESAGH